MRQKKLYRRCETVDRIHKTGNRKQERVTLREKSYGRDRRQETEIQRQLT